jgi:hypothetical protein
MKIKNIFIFIVVTAFFSCEKKIVAIAPEPHIEYVGVMPQVAKENITDILIMIKYRDGDGDLGENNPDVTNAFVVDLRNMVEYKLRIKQLAPDNANIAITGDLNLNIGATSIIGDADSEPLKYAVYIADRAGNKSNIVFTELIMLEK